MNDEDFKKVQAAIDHRFTAWLKPATSDVIVNVEDAIVRKAVGAPPIPRDFPTMEAFIQARAEWVVKANEVRHRHLCELEKKLAPEISSIESDHWDVLHLAVIRL